MATVTVRAPLVTTDGGWPGVAAEINVDGRPYNIFFRASQGPLATGAEPFLAAALIPAMAVAAPIQVEAPLTRSFVAHAGRIQEILASWNRDLKKVPITTAQPSPDGMPRPAAGIVSRGAGCFFSAGVDSFYSVLKHADELTTLITVYGWDIPLADRDMRVRVSKGVHEVAGDLHKQSLEMETNIRSLLDVYTSWQDQSCGAAAAGAALVLSPQLHTVYVAGGYPYWDMHPSGAAAIVTNLWSNSAIDIADDGREASRYQKIVRVVQSETAMRHLRVCWQHRNRSYNCGECPKCLHTMIDLELAGALQRCATFTYPLDANAIRALAFNSLPERLYFEEALAIAEQQGTHPELAESLRSLLGGEHCSPQLAQPTDETAQQLRKDRIRIRLLQGELDTITSSSSWRLTAPLRRAGRRLRRLRGGG